MNKDLVNTPSFGLIIDLLETEKVKINSGPYLNKLIKFAPPVIHDFRKEYSDLEVTIEAVDSVEDAVNHINKYGSHHTDSIVTQNSECFFVFV